MTPDRVQKRYIAKQKGVVCHLVHNSRFTRCGLRIRPNPPWQRFWTRVHLTPFRFKSLCPNCAQGIWCGPGDFEDH